MIYQCTLGQVTAGVVTDDSGMIVETAPFFKWAKGFPFEVLIGWLKTKGGVWEEV